MSKSLPFSPTSVFTAVSVIGNFVLLQPDLLGCRIHAYQHNVSGITMAQELVAKMYTSLVIIHLGHVECVLVVP